MSPNPEACDEELPFREGQLIKVRPYIILNGGTVGVRLVYFGVRRGYVLQS